LLLTLSVLLTQSVAAFAHAHAGLRLPGHDPRPHFHADLSPPGGHDHDHGPDGHRHDDDEGDLPDLDDRPLACPPPPGHDADAVFVSGVDAVAPERAALKDDSAARPLWDFSEPRAGDSFLRVAPNDVPGPPRFPSACRYSCPIYVRHLTLVL